MKIFLFRMSLSLLNVNNDTIDVNFDYRAADNDCVGDIGIVAHS